MAKVTDDIKLSRKEAIKLVDDFYDSLYSLANHKLELQKIALELVYMKELTLDTFGFDSEQYKKFRERFDTTTQLIDSLFEREKILSKSLDVLKDMLRRKVEGK